MASLIKKAKIRIAIFLCSFTVSLLFAESLLRLISYFYSDIVSIAYLKHFDSASKDYAFESFTQPLYHSSILTIGDSYTNAGNAPGAISYPSFLYEILKNNNHSGIRVINHGRCEETTLGALEQLEDFLSKNKKSPEISFKNFQRRIFLKTMTT